MEEGTIMRKHTKWTKRISSAMRSAVMVAGLFAGAVPGKVEASKNNGKKTYEEIMKLANNEPSDFKDNKDPYGKGEGNDFMLVTQNELFLLETDGSSKTATSYSKLKAGNTNNPLFLADDKQDETGKAGYTDNYSNSYTSDLDYVQAVSFDPYNHKRKDSIAMIGLKKSSNTSSVVLRVIDKAGNKAETTVGTANWMAQACDGNDNMWDFNSMNFLCVTAGDYNGNGVDSIVVYACLDDKNYGLFQYSFDGSSLSLNKVSGNNKEMLLHLLRLPQTSLKHF